MQSHILRNALRAKSRLFPLFALLLLLAACGGSGSGPEAQLPASPPAAVVEGLPELPWEHPLPRSVRVITEQTQDGSQAIQTSAGAVVAAESLQVNSVAKSLEYGMYQFPLGGNDPVNFNFELLVSGGDQAWLGAANFERGRWDFFGPFAIDPGNRPLSADHISPAGNVYLLALAWDTTGFTLTEVTLTSDDGVILPGSISGRVEDEGGSGLPGVTLTLSPGGDSEVSDASGNFSFADIEPGFYTVTPALSGFSFAPSDQPANVVSGEESVLADFVGSEEASGPGISGVITEGGEPLSGVKVTLIQISGVNTIVENFAVTSEGDGSYSFINLDPGTYRVVPLLSGFAFTPNIVPITVDGAEEQDFSAQEVTIPATVTYDGNMRPWLFEPICMNCHHSQYGPGQRNNAALAVNWDTYDGTTELKKISGENRVAQDTMPPNFLLPETRVTAFQQQLFAAWKADNFPEN